MARAGEIKDGAAQALEYYLSDPNFHYLLANRDMLTEKEAKQISLYNVLGYASGLASAIKDGDLISMRRHAGRPEGYLKRKKSRNWCRRTCSFPCSSLAWKQGSDGKRCLLCG